MLRFFKPFWRQSPPPDERFWPPQLGGHAPFFPGIGCEEALCSASHGAGRAMSRQEARNSFSRYALNQQLAQRGVTLLGGSTEEAPDAYKSIDEVLTASKQLIKVVGRIHPRIVRMNQE